MAICDQNRVLEISYSRAGAWYEFTWTRPDQDGTVAVLNVNGATTLGPEGIDLNKTQARKLAMKILAWCNEKGGE